MIALSLATQALGYSRESPVLRDVQMTVEAGESVALLGGNGAGKTALLHFIAGLLPSIRGQRAAVRGEEIESARDAVRAGVGLVVQEPDDQILGATVRADTEIGPRNLGLPPAEVTRRTESALALVGALPLADRAVESLSFGERKRVSLAGVLAMRPVLLLLDEPTAGLDPVGEVELCATLRGLSSQGVTLVVATHAVDLVPHFATRAVLLGEGRVLADGPCRDVLGRAELLARARVRRPWPAELFRRLREARTASEDDSLPLTLEEVLRCLQRPSS